MAIIYSGGTIVDNSTFRIDTLAHCCADLETYLVTAGWSVISGTGTSDVMFECAATPLGNKHRLRVSAGSSSNVAFRMYDTSGSPMGTQALDNVVNATPFRIIAHKHGFHLFLPGSSSVPGSYVACETLSVPSFVDPYPDNSCYLGINRNQTGGAFGGSFRSKLWWDRINSSVQVCYNNTSWERFNQTGGWDENSPQLVIPHGNKKDDVSYRWSTQTCLISEPLVAWALTYSTGFIEPKIRGQMYNACVVSDEIAADQTFSMDGHNWLSITDSNTGVSGFRGSLCVALN